MARWCAVDCGAESGRVMVVDFAAEAPEIVEVHRFPQHLRATGRLPALGLDQSPDGGTPRRGHGG